MPDDLCTSSTQKIPLLPYDTPPQPGDTVVIAASPFIRWMMQQDKAKNPEYARRYSYDRLPPRKDKLDKWFWATCIVVQLKPPMATLKADGLGTKQLPIECLRVLKRND